MKKFVSKLITLAICACMIVTGSAIAGCAGNGAGLNGDKLHTVDSRPLGGDTLLDEGGAIKTGGSVYSFQKAVYEESDEHKIFFKTDTDKFELIGGQTVGAWNNSDNSYGRIQVMAESKAVIFKMDFSEAEDVSNIGCALNLIACRGSVLLSVSTDKENWKDIGYNSPNGIICDAKIHLDELNGNGVKDTNLYRMYYLLGEYLGESKILYLKAGFSQSRYQGPDAANNKIGSDLIDYIAYYDSIKLVGISV